MSCSKVQQVPARRSCAFCLNPLTEKEVRKCAACHRRAYCSRECQVADWKQLPGWSPNTSPKASGCGQGHKNWCSLPCGEEGVDWAIRWIDEDKGRGLVALRDLPPMYKILVEGSQVVRQAGLDSHPGFLFLQDPNEAKAKTVGPDTDDFYAGKSGKERRFIFNSTPEEEDNGDPMWELGLGFRHALANHACDANAAVNWDGPLGAYILYSTRAIKEGEEICVQYLPFNNLVPALPNDIDLESALARREERLWNKWGIRCPSTCICKGEALRSKLKEMRALLSNCYDGKDHQFRYYYPPEIGKNLPVNYKLEKVKKVLKMAKEARLPPLVMAQLHFIANGIAESAGPGKADLSKGYAKKVLEFVEAVYNPENFGVVQRARMCAADPGLASRSAGAADSLRAFLAAKGDNSWII